jgi:hypothetical protein
VLLLASGDHLSGRDVQRGEEIEGAMADVVVCSPFRSWGLGEPGELASADYLCDTPQAVARLLGT